MDDSKVRQPWIESARFDLLLILGPAFLTSLLCYVANHFFVLKSDGVSHWQWFLLVVGVDVTHVYATLWRTYLHPIEGKTQATLFKTIPLLCFFASVLLYSLSPMIFWRVLAYLAVFHFIRQQYGFFSIYARKENHRPRFFHRLSSMALYSSALAPLIYWHTHSRNFHWFIDGDFFKWSWVGLAQVAIIIHLALILVYAFFEYRYFRKEKFFNWPKNLLLLGTMASWWTGIVVFDSDWTFTLTNVISHGVPYTALVWLYARKESRRSEVIAAATESMLFKLYSLLAKPMTALFFLLLPFFFAFFEEGLWDSMIWREHGIFFSWFYNFPKVESAEILVWLIPLLALPQTTHYVLDGFIWKLRKPRSDWQTEMFYQEASIV